MDLLFSKYASPFLFLDQVISTHRLSETVISIVNIDNDRKMWELYLACVSNAYAEVGSFEDFKAKYSQKTVDTKENIEATVKTSYDMLNNFNPEGGD